MEPGAESAHRGIEHCAGTQRTANALRENDLVVFGGDGGHHQAEDMEERAAKEDPTRTIVVIKLAKDGALCQVSECHSSSGRVELTPTNMENVSSEGIQAIVLGE
jgi:hypothetical protein